MHLRPRVAAALAFTAAPGSALAHASGRMVILTLPTGPSIAAAGATVALTAAIGLLLPRLPAPRPVLLLDRRRLLPERLPSWIACAVLLALVAAGFLGDRDPLANPLPLAIWTGLWVGLSLACLVFGNLWRPIDPWSGPAHLLRRTLGRRRGVGLARLGAWPACAGYLAFAWFEIVSLAPADPAILARAVLGYWLLVLVLAVLEGEDWLATGEAFSLYFAIVGRIAPLWTESLSGKWAAEERRGTFVDPAGAGCGQYRGYWPQPGTHRAATRTRRADPPAFRTGSKAGLARVRHRAGLPGVQVLAMPPLAPSAAAFVALVLAAVSFDGLSETFRWLALLGINPLEFPGRSAVLVPNTLGLLAAWPLTLGLVLGAIALGRRLDGRRGRFRDDAGRWMLSFLPIAAGYHAAHYLVALLTDGQYAVAAINDPFGRGWSLLGLPHHWVSFGFLSIRAGVAAIWGAQVALLLGAHVLAVLLGLRLAGGSVRLHLPMTVLMVAYTVLGLWLLSTATGA